MSDFGDLVQRLLDQPLVTPPRIDQLRRRNRRRHFRSVALITLLTLVVLGGISTVVIMSRSSGSRGPRITPGHATRTHSTTTTTSPTTTTTVPVTSTWSISATFPTPVGSFTQIMCPSTTICYAIGDNPVPGGRVSKSTNGGKSWSTQTLPKGIESLNSLACPTTLECIAVGSATTPRRAGIATPVDTKALVVVTRDGGLHWTNIQLPIGATTFADISCPTPQSCAVVGYEVVGEDQERGVVFTTSDGGLQWTDHTVPGEYTLGDISCASAQICYANGNLTSNGNIYGAISTTDGGTRWQARNLPTDVGDVGDLWCTSATSCSGLGRLEPFSGTTEASTSGVLVTSNGGTTWTHVPNPPNITTITARSCLRPDWCRALGTDANRKQVLLTSTDGELQWTSTPLPVSKADFSTLACASETACVLDGQTASVGSITLSTGNGGKTWSTRTYAYGVGDLYSIACPSATRCVAGGSTGSQDGTFLGSGAVVTTDDGGRHWTRGALPTGVSALEGITCPTATECLLADVGTGTLSSAVVSRDGGEKWTEHPLPKETNTQTPALYITSISCGTATDCVAAAGYDHIIVTTNGGVTWTVVPLTSNLREFSDLHCRTASTCTAVAQRTTGSFGRTVLALTTDGGQTWTTLPFLTPYGQVHAVTCSTEEHCIATVVADVNPVTTGPTKETLLVSTNAGRTWAPASLPPGVTIVGPATCLGPTRCVAPAGTPVRPTFHSTITTRTFDQMLLTTDGGSTWSLLPAPSGVRNFQAVACPAANTCDAVGLTKTNEAAIFRLQLP